jgi:hypothetical protein
MNRQARGRRGNRVATVPWNGQTPAIAGRESFASAGDVLRRMFSASAPNATVRLPNFEFPLAVLAQLHCWRARD